MPYTFIDHTGDLAILVRENTLEALFTTAARALFEIMADASAPPSEPVELSADGTDEADLLRTWLADLLYKFSAEGTILAIDAVHLENGCRLTARGRGRRFDPAQDALRTELKAVTYHQLEVKRDEDGWSARVVFDV